MLCYKYYVKLNALFRLVQLLQKKAELTAIVVGKTGLSSTLSFVSIDFPLSETVLQPQV
jgi:hypothetical protein